MNENTVDNLDVLLKPSSMAIIGATDKPGSFGMASALNSQISANSDRTYFVNPTRTSLLGRPCFASLSELPEIVDCVQICIPAEHVCGVLAEAGQLGVKAAVVYASGFSECLDENRVLLEKEMVRVCKHYGITLLGPNCLGVANNLDSVYQWGMPLPFEKRSITRGTGIVSQSGALLVNVAEKAAANVGLAISVGNGSVIGLEHCLDAMVDDDRIYGIFLYMEGVRDGELFCSALAKAAALSKPVVVLKSGSSEKGAQSTASHTGMLAGNDQVYQAVFDKFGVIRAESPEQFLCLSLAIAMLDSKYPEVPGCATISFSGGEAAVMADLANRAGIDLVDLHENTIQIVQSRMPTFATAKNPFDATTAMFRQNEAFFDILCAIANDSSVGSILLNSDLKGASSSSQKCSLEAIARYKASGDNNAKFFILPNHENTRDPEARELLSSLGIPVLSCGELGLRALRKLIDFAQFAPSPYVHRGRLRIDINKTCETAKVYAAVESMELLESIGVGVPPYAAVTGKCDLKRVLETISLPIAMKVDSPDIPHKTDAGGVRLGITSREEAEAAFDSILQSCRAHNPQAKILGMLVQEMAPIGTEVIIGIKNDPTFGPFIVVGLGGVFTELLSDVAISLCPITEQEALAMLRNLKAHRVFFGYRNTQKLDVDELVRVMVELSGFAACNSSTVREMELNPVVLGSRGVTALDALIIVTD